MKRAALLAVLLAAIAATDAEAELTQKGDLFVHFDGGIAPRALPRRAAAPISVHVEGTIRQIGGAAPPALSRIEVALNRAGRLETEGLPVCTRGRIRDAGPAEAIGACGPALIGSGGYTVRTTLPGQTVTVSPGEILLFNSRDHGRPSILAKASQSEPVPLRGLFVFSIRHRRRGAYGYVIAARVPPGISRDGYLKSIYLQLGRTYAFRGRRRSYLRAACAAPAGFRSALFPFAHASMSFADGRTLSSTLTRSCRVR
ncbi:MAG TPA: hypothetical protein VFN85_06230 [Solirubrobacterales bacterium]|nr:hypothetical protein [Solirubrobacterales bacterium]